jgi:HTH-type transcriptional regulator/antitoxin HipB
MKYALQTTKQLSAHLRSLRVSKGYTQSQLAARVGVPQSRISKIEMDPSAVRLEQLVRILAALGAQIIIETQPDTKKARQPATSSDW